MVKWDVVYPASARDDFSITVRLRPVSENHMLPDNLLKRNRHDSLFMEGRTYVFVGMAHTVQKQHARPKHCHCWRVKNPEGTGNENNDHSPTV